MSPSTATTQSVTSLFELSFRSAARPASPHVDITSLLPNGLHSITEGPYVSKAAERVIAGVTANGRTDLIDLRTGENLTKDLAPNGDYSLKKIANGTFHFCLDCGDVKHFLVVSPDSVQLKPVADGDSFSVVPDAERSSRRYSWRSPSGDELYSAPTGESGRDRKIFNKEWESVLIDGIAIADSILQTNDRKTPMFAVARLTDGSIKLVDLSQL